MKADIGKQKLAYIRLFVGLIVGLGAVGRGAESSRAESCGWWRAFGLETHPIVSGK